MEVVDLVEDILSDEYEEGEILDEDILYENVSSLEEFSEPDEKKVGSKGRNDVKKLKYRRKKEHKCKDDSVCRKERSGKHCYARIRKRRTSLDSKLKNSSAKGVSLDFDKKPRPAAARIVSPTRGSAKKDSFTRETTKGKGKTDDRGRYQPYYFQHDNRDRANPPRRNASDRRPARTRRFSADDRRDSDRKRKSPSPRQVVKHHHEANRVVAKTSLLDRLVGSGSIPQKSGVSCESDDCSTKVEHPTDAEQEIDTHSEVTLLLNREKEGPEAAITVDINEEPTSESTIIVNTDVCDTAEQKDDAVRQMHNLCPEDIPVPPTPKATSPVPEPPKEEIDELHLRLFALKTAIMKKQNDFKRKKRLAASKKSFVAGNDSFTEFALMGLGDDECESIPTPPPPGTDSWPAPAIRDLDDPRWSDEDMVIDQESNYGDTIIEANIPASDPNLQNYVRHSISASSQSSQDKLPCCKGNPIPVVSQHRPVKEIEERRPGLSSSTSVIIPVQEIKAPPVQKETPKYLKEINSNRNSGLRRRRPSRRPRRRRNSLRQRTPAVRRVERSMYHKESISKKSRVFEGDDDEDALRQLALMSVKPKSTITGGMLAKVGDNLNPLHIETDPVALESKSESPAKNTSPAETWEDIDEDILRAQLLSSLTRNIPVAPSQPTMPPLQTVSGKRVVIEHNVSLRKDVLTKRLNKENLYTKRNVIVHPNSMKSSKRNSKKYVNPNAKPSLTPPLNPPIVEKFIIKVSESDSSEDEEKTIRGKIVSDFETAVCQKLDIESSIDKLLEEARKETELIQKATPYYPMYDVSPEAMAVLKEETTSAIDDATNQIVKSELRTLVEPSLALPSEVANETTSLVMHDPTVQKVKSELPSPVEQNLASPLEIADETTSLATFDATDEKLKPELPTLVDQSFVSPSEIADVGVVATPGSEDEDSQQSPQGTSHLPAWQQEEFERQKRIMAQKESVIAAAKEKIIAKNKLAAESASEELSKKCSSSKPPSTPEKSNFLSDDIIEKITDRTILSADTNLMTADSPEKTSVGCDSKAVDVVSCVNTCVTVLEPKGGSMIPSDSEDDCLQSEVRTCIEVILTKICTEMDTDLSGCSQTSSKLAPDTTANTCGLSKSEAVSSDETKMSVEIPLELGTSKPILSNPKITANEIPLVAVSPSKTSAGPTLPVCRPPVTTAPGRMPSSTQAPSSKQLKQLLQNKMLQLYKIGVSSKNVPRTVAGPDKVVALKKSPARVSDTIQKMTQPPFNQPTKQLVGSLPNDVALSAVKKSLFAVKDSSYALKGLNEMTDMVAGLESGMSEYRNLRKEFIAQRKQLMLIQQKVSKKRQQLLEMKDTIENKKRLLQSTISMDTSSLSPLPDTRDQPKQSSRASELLTLKFKEVCLKAQFAMMGLETASRPQAAVKMSRPAEDLNLSPRKKMKLKARQPVRVPVLPPKVPKASQSESTDPGTSQKLVVSVRDKDKMDPLIPLCPYDIKGVCKDEECQYQHLKN